MPVIATIAATTAIAKTSLSTFLIYGFVALVTFINLYAFYKNYFNPRRRSDIHMDAVRRERLQREERISEHSSQTTLQLQEDAQAVVGHFQQQRENFGHLIENFEQTIAYLQSTTQTLEQAQQVIHTSIIKKLCVFLDGLKTQYTTYCSHLNLLSDTLTTTNQAISDRELEFKMLVDQLKQLETQTQKNVEQISVVTRGLDSVNDLEATLQSYKHVISTLKKDNKELYNYARTLLGEVKSLNARLKQLLVDTDNPNDLGDARRHSPFHLKLFDSLSTTSSPEGKHAECELK